MSNIENSNPVDTTISPLVPDAAPDTAPVLDVPLPQKPKKGADRTATPESVGEVQTLIDQIADDPGPVMTIDKFLDQDDMGWAESHRMAWIQHHGKKFLTVAEWKTLLTAETNKRA